MDKIKVTAILLAGCLLFGSDKLSAPNVSLPLHDATYSVPRNGFQIGVADFDLTRKPDGSFSYRSKTQPTGLAALFFGDVIIESSDFTLTAGQPHSLRYRYMHTGGHHDKSEEITFDWATHRAESVSDGHRKQLKITGDVADRALAQLEISLDLAAGKLADSYQVLDHGKITDYRMQRENETTLKILDGSYRVIKVARRDTKNKRVTTFWLAPKFRYLPVKIEQTEPGKATINLTLTRMNLGTAKSN